MWSISLLASSRDWDVWMMFDRCWLNGLKLWTIFLFLMWKLGQNYEKNSWVEILAKTIQKNMWSVWNETKRNSIPTCCFWSGTARLGRRLCVVEVLADATEFFSFPWTLSFPLALKLLLCSSAARVCPLNTGRGEAHSTDLMFSLLAHLVSVCMHTSFIKLHLSKPQKTGHFITFTTFIYFDAFVPIL